MDGFLPIPGANPLISNESKNRSILNRRPLSFEMGSKLSCGQGFGGLPSVNPFGHYLYPCIVIIQTGNMFISCASSFFELLFTFHRYFFQSLQAIGHKSGVITTKRFFPSLAKRINSKSVKGFNQGSLGNLDWNEILYLLSSKPKYFVTLFVVLKH